MPSTVHDVFGGAGLVAGGVVRWGEPVSESGPGVYVVALTRQTGVVTGTHSACPVSEAAVKELLRVRPELLLDGRRPTVQELTTRLADLWLADETVVYIGLAGTSLRRRVGDYYSTPLGARRPHAGGWPLKTLSLVGSLSVHYARCDDAAVAEQRMLDAFITRISAEARAGLHDPGQPIPFANLERGKGQRKQHGITGARAPAGAGHRNRGRAPRSAARISTTSAAPISRALVTSVVHVGPIRSQRVTETDIQAGRIRFPSSAKAAFPAERGEVEVTLRGLPLVARWHPHYDHDRQRSGVLLVGRQALTSRVTSNEVLSVAVDAGRVALS